MLRLSAFTLLMMLPVGAQVKEVAPYRFDGGLEDVARRRDRLALPSLQFQRPLPAAHRLALDRVSVPVWLVVLSDQLPVLALVSRYLTN